MSISETRLGGNTTGSPAVQAEPVLPGPTPLPPLTTAFSRRRAVFGAVALAAAPVAAAAMSAEMLPNGAVSVLSTNDARLVVLADAYEELERRCNAHTAAHRGSDRDEAEDEFNALTEGFGPIEDEMAETPADTMAGGAGESASLPGPDAASVRQGRRSVERR